MVLGIQMIPESVQVSSDGMPQRTGTSNPTERAVIKAVKVPNDVAVIDKCFNTVPNEYKKGVCGITLCFMKGFQMMRLGALMVPVGIVYFRGGKRVVFDRQSKIQAKSEIYAKRMGLRLLQR